MKKREDTFRGMIIVLALICAAAGLTLGATYRLTRGRIEAQQQQERMAALGIVLPEAHKDGFLEIIVARGIVERLLGNALQEHVGGSQRYVLVDQKTARRLYLLRNPAVEFDKYLGRLVEVMGPVREGVKDRRRKVGEGEGIPELSVLRIGRQLDATVPKPAFATDGRYYEAYDKPLAEASRELLGYALEGSEIGYSSTIRVTVGVDPSAEIIRGIKITFQQETPGLGANCEAVEPEGTLWDALVGKLKQTAQLEPRFQAGFHEKRADSFRMVGNKYQVKVGDEYQEIDGMTGATITKNAVISAVLDAVEEFKERVLKTDVATK